MMGSVYPGGWMLRSALLSAQGGGSPALDRMARDEVRTGLPAYALVELILRFGMDRIEVDRLVEHFPRRWVSKDRMSSGHAQPCKRPDRKSGLGPIRYPGVAPWTATREVIFAHGASLGSPMWVRIARTVGASVMKAIISISPPQRGHTRGNSS